jgi:hypothetical protein
VLFWTELPFFFVDNGCPIVMSHACFIIKSVMNHTVFLCGFCHDEYHNVTLAFMSQDGISLTENAHGVK